MVGKVLAKEMGVMMCCRAAAGVAGNSMSERGVHCVIIFVETIEILSLTNQIQIL